MGSEDWQADWGCSQGAHEVGDLALVGANTSVRTRRRKNSGCSVVNVTMHFHRNSSAPRLASSSKDGTVRVWSTLMRRCEYALGGHTASVNVVRWGGGGLNGKGVLYTASSDRTVRVWDANGVSIYFVMSSLLSATMCSCNWHYQGKCLHILKDHAHWVTTLTLNTDFVLRTGPFDHLGKKSSSDSEGTLSSSFSQSEKHRALTRDRPRL